MASFIPSTISGPATNIRPQDVLWGSPTARSAELETLSSPVTVGVWEMTGGAFQDVEADEIFVVIAGRASLTVNGRMHEVAPGDIVRLHAGDRTIWAVQDVIRKVYIAPAAPAVSE